MRNILILIIFLSPVFASAQILRAYGVIEIGSLPTSSATGPKFAYRPADSSFYRWVSGSTWVKIIPDEPDTLYLKQISGTTALVDGDTIDISTYFLKSDTTSAFASYLKRPVGWGLSLLTGKYPFVDSSKVASRYYVSTSPTTIANNYIATSNGSNLVARNLFDNNTYVGILNSKPFQLGQWTTAGRPTGITGYDGFNTSFGEHEYYNISDWYFRSPWKQSTSSANVFLNSGSAIVNTSSVINSNYKFQVNGAATYRNASFTTNEAVSAFLDIRGGTMTGQSGSTHNLAGINIEGTMLFNTVNQTYTGIRINTNSNATSSQFVYPLDVTVNSAILAESRIINTTAGSGIRLTGASTLNSLVLRSPDGGGSGSARPGLTFSDGSASPYSWAITGGARAMVFYSNPSSGGTGAVSETMLIKGQRVYIGIYSADPTAKLEVRGEGSTSSTYTAKFQNTTLTNNGFMLLDDGRASFGVATGDASAKLTVTSTTQGFLPPRWTAAQRGVISSPATGLLGYQTDGTEGLYVKQASAFKRLLWEGDAVNTWLKPSLEAGSVNINQGRVNKLRLNQDSSFFHLKNGVIYLQHPSSLDVFTLLPTVVITDDTTARWDRAFAVVAIGSRLGTGKSPGYGYTLLGSLTRGVSNGYAGFSSSALGYDIQIDSTIKVNAIGHKISANRVTDSDAYGGYITFAKDVNNSGAYGSAITVNRNQSFVYGRGISTRHTNEFLYGSSFSPKHTFSGSKVMFGLDSTFSFNITTKLLQLSAYGTSATTAATLGKTESGYLASFATDGTVLSRAISSLSNGIYSSSATLSNHTTRARVPDDGNLFFSQTYNGGADSSFFYFANATSGERYVGLGMTDTASTGGASLLIGNDGAGEMSFELQTIDAVNGNTQIRGVGGDLNMSSSAGNISLSTNVANEVRVTGLIRSKQEAYYEITSTSSPQTFSNDYSDNFVNQGGTQASFTFLFPASPENGQILSMTWNNAISVLTLDGNGNTITGTAVTTAVAGTRRQFKYYASASAWIKIY